MTRLVPKSVIGKCAVGAGRCSDVDRRQMWEFTDYFFRICCLTIFVPLDLPNQCIMCSMSVLRNTKTVLCSHNRTQATRTSSCNPTCVRNTNWISKRLFTRIISRVLRAKVTYGRIPFHERFRFSAFFSGISVNRWLVMWLCGNNII
jgi:hypothetical protein